ncbi:hypothetical protein Scep_021353 [Stephania cephalantha]|uniref:Protein kinase domain-containing protein n=1 Tax=Stephania cephalantha TaxID=152367 RepID=A0AAP0F473_9MAGN
MARVMPPLVFFFIFTLCTNSGTSASQDAVPHCSLNFESSFHEGRSNCNGGYWGGFLKKNCCETPFELYLSSLSEKANRTGTIYVNATEQMSCLTSLKSYQGDALGCGFKKLTSGSGGCSDFSVADVVDKLGDELGRLDRDCKHLEPLGEVDQGCNACLKTWGKLALSINSNKEFAASETDVCRFAVLVSLLSRRITDDKWIRKFYECLGEQSDNVVEEETSTVRKHDIKKGLWILIGAIIGTAVIIAITACVLLKTLRKSNSQPEPEEELQHEEPAGCHKIPIREIYSATDNLNAMNFIGQGMAGKVYKGVLPNGRQVAVKHINNDKHMETFVREVRSLSHVRHPNLVSLLGFCEEQKECFLVYELCHNGNLSEWLYDKDKVLSWNQRLEIAISSARGLSFLHSYPEGCIVHRDIKPTNILLGPSFRAKLSDFGLSKVMDLGQSYVSSEVRGTFGYVDPEYQKNHKVTSHGDVYSFGIVLLQILSGRKVINLDLHKPMPLDKMARSLVRGGNIAEFVDPKLNGEFSNEGFNIVLKLALSCTSYKQQRPTMEKVIRVLEKVLDLSRTEKGFTSYTSSEC